MRIALGASTLASLASLAVIAGVVPRASAELSRGLSLEQIRGVMNARGNVAAFNACLTAATRRNRQLHGPFVYQIQVDKKGNVTSARPYQPSSVASFDRCITQVVKRAKFPGGPASVETAIPFGTG